MGVGKTRVFIVSVVYLIKTDEVIFRKNLFCVDRYRRRDGNF